MNAPGERLLHVGHGSFDPLSGELRLNGRAHKLRPRTAALLAYLVRHGDRVVNKDELMQSIWPDVVVTEDSMVQCIKEIRQALGSSGREWIRTVPRRGYAFVGATSSPDNPPPEVVPPRRGRWLWIAVAVTLPAAAVLVSQSMRPQATSSSAPPLSLIVLPLVNQTGDAARDHVADDLTDRLATALSRFSGTTVIAPGTAFTFKGKAVDARRIGDELAVRYVIEGSVRQHDARTVLSVRLADTSTAVQVWGADFAAETPLDIVPEEVAAGVARSLSLRLDQVEAQRSKRERPLHPDALDLLARGRAAMRWALHGSDQMMQARAMLEEAVRRDETLADGWAHLSMTYIINVRFSTTRDQDLRRAGDAADRALSLAPDSADAHLARALVLYESRRMPLALAELDRAIELNPNDPVALGQRGAALIMLGRPDEALQPIEKAIRLSPRDPKLAHWQMFHGVADLHLGRDAAAVEWLTRSVENNARGPFNLLFLASALGRVGRLDEARMRIAQLEQLRPGFTLGRFRDLEPSDAPAFKAQRERVYDGLRRAGMPE